MPDPIGLVYIKPLTMLVMCLLLLFEALFAKCCCETKTLHTFEITAFLVILANSLTTGQSFDNLNAVRNETWTNTMDYLSNQLSHNGNETKSKTLNILHKILHAFEEGHLRTEVCHRNTTNIEIVDKEYGPCGIDEMLVIVFIILMAFMGYKCCAVPAPRGISPDFDDAETKETDNDVQLNA